MSDKTARNDVTGDLLRSKPANDMFENGWDRIFGNKKKDTLAEYQLNKSTGEVEKVEDGTTTNTQE